MPTLVLVLRVVPLLAFAAAMLGSRTAHRDEEPAAERGRRDTSLGPLAANFAAVAVFVPALLLFARSPAGSISLLLAASGSLLALAGVALVVRARAALGPAWSLAARADRTIGLAETGPYRFVRHPIYFGLVLLTAGEAIAFGSWPALLIVLFGIVPTFAWRARTEEKVLCRVFGERYAAYRQRTRLIVPYVF
jgi:protein-S-isoprenylcysteine O-methyltransferase Ste14